MPGFEVFQTRELAPQRRLEYWNELACNTFTPVVADTADIIHFTPSLIRARMGALCLGLVRSSPSIVHHGREHVARTREAMFFLHVQITGSSWNHQDGREALLEAGDFTLFDSTRPYKMSLDAANKVLVVGIPDALLRRQLPHPEGVTAMRMAYGETLNRVLSDFSQSYWRQCRLDAEAAEITLTSALLSLLAGAYTRRHRAGEAGSAHIEAMRLRIVHHVEQHLGDPELSPKSIAAVLKTSPRYVHTIFTRDDETLCRYILRRRLEESARLLGAASHRSLSVSAIAFDHGFASGTNFGKVFRERFGITPTEYRRQQLGAAQPSARPPVISEYLHAPGA
jgi:AraC-like DNA-binding protein